MKKQIIVFASAVLFAAGVFTACKKDNSAAETDFQTTSTDLVTVEDLSEQAEIDADLAIEERGGNTGCPTITSTQPIGVFPNTITVDFGTDGCTRPNGRVLKGQIIINQSAPRTELNATRVATFQDFYVNDVRVDGSHTAVSNGLDASGNPFWSRTGTKTLTWPDGKTATWESAHTVTQTEGNGTPELADNVWKIEGSCSGTNRNGQDFTSEITEPLIKRANCRWIVDGMRTIEHGIRSRTIDFGDGDCDNDATVTTGNGKTFAIKLRG